MSDATHEPHAIFEHEGHVAVVTLNRPEKRNALSSEMLVRMYDAWVEIDSNPDIRVAIVTGAGGNFCSGADLKAMAGGYGDNDNEWSSRMATDDDLHWKALLRHFIPGKPLIAAVEGSAVAGGTENLQAMDIRVAGEGATFGVAEVRRGLFPLGGSTVRLSRQIPYTVAADMLLTGRFVPAAEAKQVGLIGHVVPDGQALAKAHEIAEAIASNGPLAVQAVLRSMRATRELPEREGLALELEIGWPIFSS
jgi:enoyl-CoA hydratase